MICSDTNFLSDFNFLPSLIGSVSVLVLENNFGVRTKLNQNSPATNKVLNVTYFFV